jgi:hypothetical protein
MADDEQGAGGRQRHLPILAAEGLLPELLTIMQMFQQQRADYMNF